MIHPLNEASEAEVLLREVTKKRFITEETFRTKLYRFLPLENSPEPSH